MAKYNIYDTKQIEQFTVQQLQAIDKALVAAAYKLKDIAQKEFVNNGRYRKLDSLKEGIMLGRLQNSSISLHSYGYNDSLKKTYKARFFVGGTVDRDNGKHSTGHIEALDTIDKTVQANQQLLTEYINKVIK